MRMRGCLLVALVLLLAVSGAALAEEGRWSGSQTVTFEWVDEGIATHSLSILELKINRDWFVTFVVDQHKEQGIDGEVSTTIYWNPFGRILYATLGARHGIYKSETPLRPFLSITYKF